MAGPAGATVPFARARSNLKSTLPLGVPRRTRRRGCPACARRSAPCRTRRCARRPHTCLPRRSLPVRSPRPGLGLLKHCSAFNLRLCTSQPQKPASHWACPAVVPCSARAPCRGSPHACPAHAGCWHTCRQALRRLAQALPRRLAHSGASYRAMGLVQALKAQHRN